MDHFEMVEKLREKTNATYEEAVSALEKCNWDLLDALLLLKGVSTLSTEKKGKGRGAFGMLMHGLATLVQKLNSVHLLIKKDGEERLRLSMTVVILLLVFVFWLALIAGVIGMACGYRFSVKGMTIDDTVNAELDKAGSFVNNVAKAGPTVVVVENRTTDDENTVQ